MTDYPGPSAPTGAICASGETIRVADHPVAVTDGEGGDRAMVRAKCSMPPTGAARTVPNRRDR